mmetsp:Transcript_9802/g.18434  ORF Transcript_9802/g.18434 Transcript_9802/m.18434 type:complete len:879 (+) Transcript_9802:420-3056(+)|eukprot:CAMPEP_0176486276 /NCGR_PEP_ID=MMETSP0200_2-20121128/5481_1 /TAXON_ID=947934 /ORGANISM="Chaetoceros sp., Strain GSL56" /LENGTH=878 /DNA_ID=CAMNT_0017882965 /DNA_START=312 /DNA_END=2948 /DNA_ORIENTATION=-
MGSSFANDSFFSSPHQYTHTNISCTPASAANDRPTTTTSQPVVGVLRQPRNRSHRLSSFSSSSSSSHVKRTSLDNHYECDHDRDRMQEGDEGYKRGVYVSKNAKAHVGSCVIDGNKISQDLGGYDCASTSTNNTTSSITNQQSLMDKESLVECDAWRKDGRQRRMKMLHEDEINGGSDFQIHYQSRLRTYSDIADRIRDQFLRAYASPDIAMEELQCIYIMGNRLINFLSKVLPTHPQYSSRRPDHVRLQAKIQHDLMTVREKVEDVAYRLDTEYYRQHMEEQGLEFVKTPEKQNVRELRKTRMKRVTFNLDLERIEYEADPFNCDHNKVRLDDGDTAFDLHDLSVWEDKDPDDGDFIDMSITSDDSSFENSFRNESKGAFGMTTSVMEVEELNVFGGTDDDGWEHYDSNPEHGGQWEWPDMIPHNGQMVHEKEHDTTASTLDMENSSNEQEQHLTTDPMHNSTRYDSDESDSDSEELNDVFGNFDDFYSGFDESFVEKISRENFTRSIDELRDNDDDSAQDSWAQCHEFDDDGVVDDDDGKQICRNALKSDSQQFHVQSDNDGFVSSGRTEDDDNLESSIDGHHLVTVDERETSMSSIDGPNGQPTATDALPRAKDLLFSSTKYDSLDYSQSSLDFSYPSSKNSSKLHVSSCTEEWDNCDFESSIDGDVFNIHDEFDNSQIIAESPSFNEESDDVNEYDELVRNVSDEFFSEKGEGLRCDSSGGEKTITTISTVDMSCETGEENSYGSPRSDNNREDESVLGILRRDTYIPTIDSPVNPRKEIGDNLDYLESKVKDLNIRNLKHPIQCVPTDADSCADRHSEEAVTCLELEAPLTPHETDSPSPVLSTCSSSPRRHPTAARLKTLRQSVAWKRRYGK